MNKSLRVTAGAYSQAGQSGANQDALAIRSDKLEALGNKGIVAVVADGVSHCQDGKLAAQTAVTGFIQDYFNTPKTWRVEQSASQVLSSLNRWLYRHNENDQRIDQQRLTTFTAAVIRERDLHVFHIGDSRAYLIRQGELQQLTKDHSYWSGSQHVLSRALGSEVQVKIDYYVHPLEQGDLVLLATDGVHHCIRDTRIMERLVASSLVLSDTDLDESCQQLVAWCAASQKVDDTTAVMLRVDQLPPAKSPNKMSNTHLPIPPALQIGQRLDGYEVVECLGATNRSLIYRVIDAAGQSLVLKAPSDNIADDSKALALFAQEEWLTRSLKHPSLVSGMERPRDATATYLLMPLVEGANLRQWRVDQEHTSLVEVRAIIKQLIEVVRHLHRQGIQHRDLRPENILIDEHGKITLIDYGSAAVAGLPPDTEQRVGALEYSAPELVLGQPCRQPDAFAIACITYELLTGHLPYGDKPARWQAFTRVSEFRYQSLLTWRPDLATWLDASLKQALSPDARQRPAALSEFWQDLNEPNAELVDQSWVPLMERNPLRFWQSVSALLLCFMLVQTWLLW